MGMAKNAYVIALTDEFLKTRPGVLCYWPTDLDSPVAGTWSITAPLAPFSADDEYEPATFRPGTAGPEVVSTEISLDFIQLPATEPSGLGGLTFTFPESPEDGYIDGSVYLIAAHCPVYVRRIDFGRLVRDQLAATLHVYFDFAAAGGIGIHNRSAVLDTALHFEVGRPMRPGTR
ncbi:hypothetical protein [Actinomadura bangladeshensis]|uniref:Uncharacterized protein n=1 Tax=Actinomadura bangladeshensis TaxID=453573 RepID=A0A4R4P4B8_9ACTN|nr:hypothetical protein [Actinomadura bangladeshensis]TDC17241.1 hypothetical protein E1284_09820 [Actinomadura bangladeshensis]